MAMMESLQTLVHKRVLNWTRSEAGGSPPGDLGEIAAV